MTNRLRIARVDASPYAPVLPRHRVTADSYGRLRALILRHLPPLAASLLAEPSFRSEGDHVEWYSDLAGQPEPLTRLPGPEQAAAKRLLDDRLGALRSLLHQLPALEPADADLVDVLQAALRYPGEETVYVVDGQPVITFWGFDGTARHAPAVGLAPPGTTAVTGHMGGRAGTAPLPKRALPSGSGPAARRRVWLVALATALLALVVAWWYYHDSAARRLQEEGEALASARREGMDLESQLRALESELAARVGACEPNRDLSGGRHEDARGSDSQLPRDARASQTLAADTGTHRGELPPCPGERQAAEAPDLAIVLDASRSMGLSEDASPTQILKLILGQLFGPPDRSPTKGRAASRLAVAKQAVSRVIDTLPPDVDVGLVVLADCPTANAVGRFSGSERSRFHRTVDALQPARGTPLADGITRAGSLVDGLGSPAVILVISDGEDSCRGDPCAAARALKASKPRLTVNVVDILGDGRSNCLAHVTGGRVLTPKGARAFEESVSEGSREVQKPDHCD